MKTTLVSSSPASSLFTLDWAKAFVRVTWDHEDTLFPALIASAVAKCEKFGRVAICRKTWDTEVEIPRWIDTSGGLLWPKRYDPDGLSNNLILPRKIADGITSVISASSLYDYQPVTANPDTYEFKHGRLVLKDTFFEPMRGGENFTVRYTAGFSSLAELTAAAPDLIEAVGFALVAGYNREEGSMSLSAGAKEILAAYWSSPTYDV